MANVTLKYLGDDKPTKGSYGGESFSIKDGKASVSPETAAAMAGSGLWEREGGPKVDAKKRRVKRPDESETQRDLHTDIARERVRPGYVVVPREVTPKQADKLMEKQAESGQPVDAKAGGDK